MLTWLTKYSARWTVFVLDNFYVIRNVTHKIISLCSNQSLKALSILSCLYYHCALFSGFKKEFEKVVSVVGDSPSRGMFIDSCFDHCQIESQETWFKSDSPHLANTVRCCITFFYLSNIRIFVCYEYWYYHYLLLYAVEKLTCMHDTMQSIAKAVGYWFYGRGPFNEVDCNYPCNPTCQNLVSDPKDHPGI